MGVFYFDTSALAKYYLKEPGTDWVRGLIDARDESGRHKHLVYTTVLTWVEIPAAIAVVHRAGRIRKLLRDRLYQRFLIEASSRYYFIGLDGHLLIQAAQLTQQHPLKAYDAVHLSSALYLKELMAPFEISPVFVSSDGQLLKAAQLEGLVARNPVDYD